jgi:phosphatidylinositol glycan class M
LRIHGAELHHVLLVCTHTAILTCGTSLTQSSYGSPFIEHSYRYHFTRIDHRHNFSIYNTVLHLNSASAHEPAFRVESLAFIPQLFLSVAIIPLILAKKDLASTMLAQTFAFVTFNKVCTSQVRFLCAVLKTNG